MKCAKRTLCIRLDYRQNREPVKESRMHVRPWHVGHETCQKSLINSKLGGKITLPLFVLTLIKGYERISVSSHGALLEGSESTSTVLA